MAALVLLSGSWRVKASIVNKFSPGDDDKGGIKRRTKEEETCINTPTPAPVSSSPPFLSPLLVSFPSFLPLVFRLSLQGSPSVNIIGAQPKREHEENVFELVSGASLLPSLSPSHPRPLTEIK